MSGAAAIPVIPVYHWAQAVDLWMECFEGNREDRLAAFKAVGFSFEPGEESAPFIALRQMGLASARIVRDPGAPPRWRPASGGEEGTLAIIVPVMETERDFCSRTMSFHMGSRVRPPDQVENIGDVIAILPDGRLASFTGYTVAVGSFACRDGRLALASNGMAWLRRQARRAIAAAAETPPDLAARMLEGPDAFETLVLDESLFEFSVSEDSCCVPEAAREIDCLDDAGFAERIAAAVKPKRRPRKPPIVNAPARGAP